MSGGSPTSDPWGTSSAVIGMRLRRTSVIRAPGGAVNVIGRRQGNRILSGEDGEEVGLIPTSLEALGFDTALGGGLLAQEIERDVAQHREVLGGMPGADAALILAKGDIQHPM